MANSIAKGYRSEQKTVKLLESLGFVVETVKKSSRRGQSNDFFGCIDHIAVKTKFVAADALGDATEFDCMPGTVFFIQTKSAGYPTKEQREKMIELQNHLRYNQFAKVFCLRWKDRAKIPVIFNFMKGQEDGTE